MTAALIISLVLACALSVGLVYSLEVIKWNGGVSPHTCTPWIYVGTNHLGHRRYVDAAGNEITIAWRGVDDDAS